MNVENNSWDRAWIERLESRRGVQAQSEQLRVMFSLGNRELTIDEFIGMVMNSSDENPAPYLRNVHLEKFLPELMEDVSPLPEYFSPNWLQGPSQSR